MVARPAGSRAAWRIRDVPHRATWAAGRGGVLRYTIAVGAGCDPIIGRHARGIGAAFP